MTTKNEVQEEARVCKVARLHGCVAGLGEGRLSNQRMTVMMDVGLNMLHRHHRRPSALKV